MAKIYTSADQLIGKTPLLELTHIEKELNLKAKILAKLEYFMQNLLERKQSTLTYMIWCLRDAEAVLPASSRKKPKANATGGMTSHR